MLDVKNRYLFRGTTLGWEGNKTNIELPRTCVTLNPIKAVLFALSCNGNDRVIYITTIDRLSNINEDKNVLAKIEEEIAFEIQPIEYAKLCEGYITVDDAISILKQLNQYIPPLFDKTLFDFALRDVKKLNKEIITKFYELAQIMLKKD